MDLTVHVSLPSIRAQGAALRRGEISVRQLVEMLLARMRTHNPRLAALVDIDGDGGLRQADQLDAELRAGRVRGPLHGIPIVVKDTIDVAGRRTTNASRVFERSVAQKDAFAVAKLRAAGAVILAKANTWELGCGVGEIQTKRLFPESDNPKYPGYFSGGSSNGSAVAVAAGLAFAALGADTGGSVRSPAAATGTIGFKPSRGLIALDGVFQHSHTLDHLGILAANVEDAAAVFSVYATEVLSPAPTPAPALPELALVVAEDLVDAQMMDPGVRSMFEGFVEGMVRQGVTIRRTRLGFGPSDARKTLEMIGGPESGRRNQALIRDSGADLSPSVRSWLKGALAIPDADYRSALGRRTEMIEMLEKALAGADAMIAPSAYRRVPPAHNEALRIRYSLESPNAVFNVTGFPALSLPRGKDGAGLPMAIQLAGRMHADFHLLAVAKAIDGFRTDQTYL